MPWHIGTSAECPASKPHAVIKDSDGEIEGCHATKDDAKKQLAALYASENELSSRTFKMMARDELIVRALPQPMDVSDDEAEGSLLSGHFALFDQWTEIDSIFEGRFMERIAPGAFRKTFRENRDAIKPLFQHGNDPEIGDRPLGTIEELKEDDEGAYYEVRAFDGLPKLVEEGLRAGAYGSSFRFRVIREDVEEPSEASDSNPLALPERTVKEVKLFEFGPVTFPAYASASAGMRMRSLTDQVIFDRMHLSTGETRNELRRLLGQNDAPSDPTPPSQAPRETERREPKRFRNREEYLRWLSGT